MALRVAVGCLARTVCRGRTLHAAALVAPGGLACCLSARVASHRPLHPSLSVPISRLPEPVRFIRPGYPALPVTIDRLPGSIRVNRPLSATRRIIIRRRSSDERKSRTGGKKKPFRVHTRNLSGRRRAVRAWRSMSEPDRVRTNRLFGRFLRRLRVLGRCLFRLDLQAFSHKVGIGGGWQCRRHWPDLGR